MQLPRAGVCVFIWNVTPLSRGSDLMENPKVPFEQHFHVLAAAAIKHMQIKKGGVFFTCPCSMVARTIVTVNLLPSLSG